MNKIVVTILLHIICMGLFAQDKQYIETMKETIATMDTATSFKTLQQAANQFERIGDAMQNQWLPYYYSAYCYVQISYLVKPDQLKDLNIEKAEELNNSADKISPDNSEIYVMKGFILQAKMNIDPMTRGFKYNRECLGMFEKAKMLDPENPRSYLWHGVNLLNTPAFMGGGKEKALPLLEKAIEKFETIHLKSDIHPDWGKEYAEKTIIKCKN
jgi:tetratricopeptide (TPR) repeat protein